MPTNGGIIGPENVATTAISQAAKITTVTASGTFTTQPATAKVIIVVVAGGGAGGRIDHPPVGGGGGGGAGGMLETTGISIASGTYTVTVGGGGPCADIP